jgi:hypothetical protein
MRGGNPGNFGRRRGGGGFNGGADLRDKLRGRGGGGWGWGAGSAIGRRGPPAGHADLFEKLLQGKRDFLFTGKGAAVAEYLGAHRGEALEGHADAATGDFLGEFLDGKAELGTGVVRAWLEEMSGDTGEDIAEAKEDFALVFTRLWSGFRIAGDSHAALI